MDCEAISGEEVKQQLARILASHLFNRSERLSRFLEFSVEAALNGEAERVKEYVIGVQVFDRGDAFDSRIDPVVRVEARRLRARLKRWHETEGRDSAVLIELPTGRYAANFRRRPPANVSGTAVSKKKTIAVLPFANLNNDPELDYFSDGLTEELIHALTRLKGLHVVAWPSAARLKGQEEDLAAVRERLQVENILRGSVRRSGDRLRMTAQLIQAADGHYLWSEAWDRTAADWLAIEQEIADAIADKLRVDLGGQASEAAQRKSPHTESHRLYLMGRFQWNKRSPEGMRSALRNFEEATKRDPEWPLAWAGLADALAVAGEYGVMPPGPSMQAAKEAAQRALALDPTLAEAIACLALVEDAYEWDWERGEELYRKAIALSPGYATAHHWYALDHLAMLGRFEEAAEEIELAIRLDPLSSILLDSRALLCLVEGRYEDALAELWKLQAQDSSFHKALSAMGRVYAEMDRYEEAIAMFQSAIAVMGNYPKTLAALGQTFGMAGQPEKARKTLETLTEIARTEYVDLSSFALIHLGLGDRGAALELLERALDAHEIPLRWLKVHPAWKRLRPEARFEAILRRVRLG